MKTMESVLTALLVNTPAKVVQEATGKTTKLLEVGVMYKEPMMENNTKRAVIVQS